MNDKGKPVTAADLKSADWQTVSMASGRGIHVYTYRCAQHPRLTLRVARERGKPDAQTMLVDGKEVGGSAEAAAALNQTEKSDG